MSSMSLALPVWTGDHLAVPYSLQAMLAAHSVLLVVGLNCVALALAWRTRPLLCSPGTAIVPTRVLRDHVLWSHYPCH